MPSNLAGQMGSQDDGPSAGSHKIGSGVPLHKPEMQPLFYTGSFPKSIKAVPVWVSLQTFSFTKRYVPCPPI